MGIFKTRKNKRFSYNNQSSPYEIKHKFDEYRSTVGNNSGLKNKFNAAIDDYKHNPDRSANRRVLIIIGVLILVFLFIIDFDLSIFFANR